MSLMSDMAIVQTMDEFIGLTWYRSASKEVVTRLRIMQMRRVSSIRHRTMSSGFGVVDIDTSTLDWSIQACLSSIGALSVGVCKGSESECWLMVECSRDLSSSKKRVL